MSWPFTQFDPKSIADEIFGPLNSYHTADVFALLRCINAVQNNHIDLLINVYNRVLDQVFGVAPDLLAFETNRGCISLDQYLMQTAPVDKFEGRLPIYYFTNHAEAGQVYRLANANDRVVINAGRVVDAGCLFNYAAHHHANVRLVPVEDVEAPGLFEPLSKAELARFHPLMQSIYQSLRRAKIGDVAVSIKRFAPASTGAVLLGSSRHEGIWLAQGVSSFLWFPENFLELMLHTAKAVRCAQPQLVLNAANSFIASLSQVSREVADATIDDIYETARLYARAQVNDDEIMYDKYVSLRGQLLRCYDAIAWLEMHRPNGHGTFH